MYCLRAIGNTIRSRVLSCPRGTPHAAVQQAARPCSSSDHKVGGCAASGKGPLVRKRACGRGSQRSAGHWDLKGSRCKRESLAVLRGASAFRDSSSPAVAVHSTTPLILKVTSSHRYGNDDVSLRS